MFEHYHILSLHRSKISHAKLSASFGTLFRVSGYNAPTVVRRINVPIFMLRETGEEGKSVWWAV